MNLSARLWLLAAGGFAVGTSAYVVSGALVPIEIDRERDEGVYVEPNVWIVHPPRG